MSKPADFLEALTEVSSAYRKNGGALRGVVVWPQWFREELDKSAGAAWSDLLEAAVAEIKRSRERSDDGMRLLAGRLLARLAGDLPQDQQKIVDLLLADYARELQAHAQL